MFDLHPPLQSLLDADPAGWSPVESLAAPHLWIHAKGLRVQVQRTRDSSRAPAWEVQFTQATRVLVLTLTRTRTRPLARRLDPVLQDIQPWIQALDLVPRNRILIDLATWLVLHNHTGGYSFLCRQNQEPDILVQPLDPARFSRRIQVPLPVIHHLMPDIHALWRKMPIPNDQYFRVYWTESRNDQHYDRQFMFHLPTSMHARMRLIATMRPEIRQLPAPEVAG